MRGLISLALCGPLLLAGCGGGGRDSANDGLTDAQRGYQANLMAENDRLMALQAAEKERRDREAEAAAAFKSNIERVLAADQTTNSGGGGASVIAERMAAIDLSGTPGDFQSAYLEHIEAWRRAGKVASALAQLKSDDRMNGAVAAGIFATVFDMNVSPFSDHIRAIQRLEAETGVADEAIRSTYATVKSVAVRYQAVIPPGA